MVQDASLIGKSVDFLENQIEQKLLEIDVAEAEYRYLEVDRLKEQLSKMLDKLRRERSIIDAHLLKYQTLGENEKKELLSSLGKEKQVSLWGFSTHTGWLSTGEGLQKEAVAYSKTGMYSQVI